MCLLFKILKIIKYPSFESVFFMNVLYACGQLKLKYRDKAV